MGNPANKDQRVQSASAPIVTQAIQPARLARLATRVLLVCAGYYAGAILGISFAFPPAGISTIWPANAVVLAALLLEPPRVWWVYLAAVLPTHLHVVATFQQAVPLPVMLSQFAGNATHVLVGATAVRAVVGASPRFDRLRDMASFVLLAAIGATAVACTLAIALFLLTGWVSDAWLAWRQRFFSNGFAVLTITPPIFLAATGELVGSRHPRAGRYAELALVALGLLAIGMVIFGRTAPGSEIMPALLLAPLPFLLWAAVRLGPGGLCCSLIVVTCVSWATVYVGRWPFATYSPSEAVLSVHAYLFTISVPMMFLSTLVEERRRGEEETRRQREELAHALRVNTLGELTASVAHELNQPLAAIMTNAQAARRLFETAPARSDAIRDALSGVVEASNRAAQVIQRLRALFRKQPGERVGLDVNTLIESTVGLLGPDLQQKRIVLRFARNDTLPLVRGDAVQLQQVVLNLIMNAVEAVAGVVEGRRVIAIDATQTAPGRLVFSVCDSGVGVKDAAGLESIFEHFNSSKPHGLGMGLTISRSIVEDHGGRIWATRNAGPGLTLHVELPSLADRSLSGSCEQVPPDPL